MCQLPSYFFPIFRILFGTGCVIRRLLFKLSHDELDILIELEHMVLTKHYVYHLFQIGIKKKKLHVYFSFSMVLIAFIDFVLVVLIFSQTRMKKQLYRGRRSRHKKKKQQ